jgi:hypothetical protein
MWHSLSTASHDVTVTSHHNLLCHLFLTCLACFTTIMHYLYYVNM